MNLAKKTQKEKPPFFSLLREEIKHIKGIVYPEIKIIIIFILMSPYDILPHFEERLICMFFFSLCNCDEQGLNLRRILM